MFTWRDYWEYEKSAFYFLGDPWHFFVGSEKNRRFITSVNYYLVWGIPNFFSVFLWNFFKNIITEMPRRGSCLQLVFLYLHFKSEAFCLYVFEKEKEEDVQAKVDGEEEELADKQVDVVVSPPV